MHVYTKIYEFAASAGAFEGYVYGKDKINPAEITDWSNNIVTGYHHLPAETLKQFQSSFDRTLGRAVKSLVKALGAEHEIVQKLRTIIADQSVESADNFAFKKWFEE